jgi:hypothetical protein
VRTLRCGKDARLAPEQIPDDHERRDQSGGCCAARTDRRLVPARIAATKAFLEQKFHLPVESVAEGGDTQGGVMTTLQAICLGAMLAWTPSLIVLALLLRDVPLDEFQRDPS